MRIYLVLSVASVVLLGATSGGKLEDAEKALLGSLGYVTTSIEELLASIFSKQCAKLKELVGANYYQIENSNSEPDVSKLTLNFITRDCYETYNISTAAEDIPNSAWFNPGHGLIVYVHGFLNDANSPGPQNVSNAFLSRGPYNIVALDSSSVLGSMYLQASTNVVYIGEMLGKVMAATYRLGLKPENMYLIGHSLGAHISSFAGKTFKILTNETVGRITGLDPAGPCFTTVNDTLKLNKEDADFVDVIHSNAGVFGLDQDVGHVDIYPNGGHVQPKCVLPTCSHNFAWHLYSESVLFPDTFPAVACDSWSDFKNQNCSYNDTALMGFACSNETRGRYYLQTRGTIPYGLKENGTKYTKS